MTRKEKKENRIFMNDEIKVEYSTKEFENSWNDYIKTLPNNVLKIMRKNETLLKKLKGACDWFYFSGRFDEAHKKKK